MKYREFVTEVNHNPKVAKVSFEDLQTIIYLGLGKSYFDIGYADVNNWVAIIGAVGHGMGKSMGIMNKAQQQAPDSDEYAYITAKDYEPEYGDDADMIAGQFNTKTGEISVNKDLLKNFKVSVEKTQQVAGSRQGGTLIHEMMHRGFNIISQTPELRDRMPADMRTYWKDDYGVNQGSNFKGQAQVSAEHALIYTHQFGPREFEWNFKSLSWMDFCRAWEQSSAKEATDVAGLTRTVYFNPSAILDPKSPIYNMTPKQAYAYFKDLFEQIQDSLATFFAQIGPPRRLGPAKQGKDIDPTKRTTPPVPTNKGTRPRKPSTPSAPSKPSTPSKPTAAPKAKPAPKPVDPKYKGMTVPELFGELKNVPSQANGSRSKAEQLIKKIMQAISVNYENLDRYDLEMQLSVYTDELVRTSVTTPQEFEEMYNTLLRFFKSRHRVGAGPDPSN